MDFRQKSCCRRRNEARTSCISLFAAGRLQLRLTNVSLLSHWRNRSVQTAQCKLHVRQLRMDLHTGILMFKNARFNTFMLNIYLTLFLLSRCCSWTESGAGEQRKTSRRSHTSRLESARTQKGLDPLSVCLRAYSWKVTPLLFCLHADAVASSSPPRGGRGSFARSHFRVDSLPPPEGNWLLPLRQPPCNTLPPPSPSTLLMMMMMKHHSAYSTVALRFNWTFVKL